MASVDATVATYCCVCDAPVRAQVVHGMPCPLGVPPDGDVFPQQLQRIGALEVQIRLQRYRPPVAEPVKGRLVRGRHSFGMDVVIFQLGTGGCNCPCGADTSGTVGELPLRWQRRNRLERSFQQRGTPVFCTVSARSATRDCATTVKRDALCTRGVGCETHRQAEDVEVCGGASASCGLVTVCIAQQTTAVAQTPTIDVRLMRVGRCLKHAQQGHAKCRPRCKFAYELLTLCAHGSERDGVLATTRGRPCS